MGAIQLFAQYFWPRCITSTSWTWYSDNDGAAGNASQSPGL